MTTDASYSLDRMLSGVLHNALNGGRCRSCGRRTYDTIIGHDGFCPVPALTRAIARIAADRAALAQALAERGAATRRAEQAEAMAARLRSLADEWMMEDGETYGAKLLAQCGKRLAAALAGQEGGPR